MVQNPFKSNKKPKLKVTLVVPFLKRYLISGMKKKIM